MGKWETAQGASPFCEPIHKKPSPSWVADVGIAALGSSLPCARFWKTVSASPAQRSTEWEAGTAANKAAAIASWLSLFLKPHISLLISVVQHPDTTTRGALDRQTIPQLVPRINGAERTCSACGSASDCRHTEAWTNRCEEGFRLRPRLRPVRWKVTDRTAAAPSGSHPQTSTARTATRLEAQRQ